MFTLSMPVLSILTADHEALRLLVYSNRDVFALGKADDLI